VEKIWPVPKFLGIFACSGFEPIRYVWGVDLPVEHDATVSLATDKAGARGSAHLALLDLLRPLLLSAPDRLVRSGLGARQHIAPPDTLRCRERPGQRLGGVPAGPCIESDPAIGLTPLRAG
jgi:hypothetical protein